MNDDDFLNRLRKAPPPEFLTGLKARLDRQPKVPPERRSGFGRGLIVGFLVAGVAFAATSVSLTGLPTSPGRFFSAPVEFLTRTVTGRNNSERDTNPVQIKAVPLGSVWAVPPHVNAQPASATGVESTASAVRASAPTPYTTGTESRVGAPGAVSKPSWGIVFGAQREIHPLAQATLQGPWAERIKLVEQPSTAVFTGLCGSNIPINHPDIIETTHRITTESSCKVAHALRVVELKVGYQAVVLARSKLYTPLNLSARDVFLALAQRVPNPAQPGQLIENPYLTWNEIDSALPYDSIEFYGPPQNSPEGQLAAELLLDAGCNSIPALVALREHYGPAFETTCRKLRTDYAYREIPLRSEVSQTDILSVTPTIVGIYTLKGFQAEQNRLNANPIDGVAPEYATLASQQYPASRTLYVYTTQESIGFGPKGWGPNAFLAALISPSFYDSRYNDSTWGFVALDEAESAVSRAYLEARKPIQF
jgi:phosphate transport system substrate-binding protein